MTLSIDMAQGKKGPPAQATAPILFCRSRRLGQHNRILALRRLRLDRRRIVGGDGCVVEQRGIGLFEVNRIGPGSQAGARSLTSG